MQSDNWGEILGPKFTLFFHTLFHPFSLLFVPILHLNPYLSHINKHASSRYKSLFIISFYSWFYLQLWILPFISADLLMIWKKDSESPGGSTATTHHILELVLLEIWYMLDGLVGINDEIILDTPSWLQLKLPENIPHFVGHVSSWNSLK